MVEVGFLGCGFIARYHAMQLAMSPVGCRVVACHDPDRRRAEAFAAELADSTPSLGAPEVCDTAAEVAERSAALFVCTWTAAHPEALAVAVERNLPVFCEKPLGVDLASAQQVAAELEALPVHAVGLVLRTSPAMQVVRELLGDDSRGAVMNVVFRDDQYLPVGGMYGSDWRADSGRSGSGTLLEHSIHDVDLLEWLVGPIEAVSAVQGFFHDLDGVEDSVTAMGGFVGGGSFALASVWHEVHDRPSLRRIEVFCENALVCLEGDVFGPVSLQSDDENLFLEGDDLVRWLADRGVQVRSTETEFLEAVGELVPGAAGRVIVPGAPEALRAHLVVDAMYRSAAAGGGRVAVAETP
jgi:predicted dehydrogenase